MKRRLPDATELVAGLNERYERANPTAAAGTSRQQQITLAKPQHNEPCLDVTCTDFLQYCKWRTELCPAWSCKRPCKMGDRCVYAHGPCELRHIRKLRMCNAIVKHNFCTYGEKVLTFSPS